MATIRFFTSTGRAVSGYSVPAHVAFQPARHLQRTELERHGAFQRADVYNLLLGCVALVLSRRVGVSRFSLAAWTAALLFSLAARALSLPCTRARTPSRALSRSPLILKFALSLCPAPRALVPPGS